ncbi:MAG: ATP synthase D chain, mitochondrial (ATP5H) [Phormidesmis priestleyi Ana]|uniref:ATP synthase D chain, mitochondrial (ATP5H) n=1 Tax=Phormidesmis priestleyi Ana TaxID=1666911 RepID=A0A0P7ZQJ6_9CYAN|nr:MAG: ATP synthase D chain, mitochondrial (ATP5H) [Phormidesmis priestleyi Ana]
MLRDTLKQEIDKLSDSQLRRIADFINSVKSQTQQLAQSIPFWQRATPVERAEDFRRWVAQLPKASITLSDEAFDRGNIYD